MDRNALESLLAELSTSNNLSSLNTIAPPGEFDLPFLPASQGDIYSPILAKEFIVEDKLNLSSSSSSSSSSSLCNLFLIIILAILICKLLNKFNIIESFNPTFNGKNVKANCYTSPCASTRKIMVSSGKTDECQIIHNKVKNGELKAKPGYTSFGGTIYCDKEVDFV